MRQETKVARAFSGIECATDVIPVDHDIWSYPILGNLMEKPNPRVDSTISRPIVLRSCLLPSYNK